MIKLTRERSDTSIHKNFRGKNRIKWNLELLKEERDFLAGTAGNHDFKKKSARWKVVKDQLLKESFNKCAYCDTPTKVIAFGDVEHFRPKSIYWWLAYCYENYLPACAVCNEQFKSDNFPFGGTKENGPVITATTTDEELKKMAAAINPDPLNETEGEQWAAFTSKHKNENPFILNPYYDKPSEIIGYKADDIIKEVELVVNTRLQNRQQIQDALDNVYGLNRLALKQNRYWFYETYNVHKDTLNDTGISAATRKKNQDIIQTMMQDDYPYAGMIRYFEKRSN